MKEQAYGDFTLAELEDFCRQSEEFELSIDEVAGGGDGATSCRIISDLVKRVRELEGS